MTKKDDDDNDEIHVFRTPYQCTIQLALALVDMYETTEEQILT